MLDPKERIRKHIEFIYRVGAAHGKSQASEIFPLLWARLETFLRQHPNLQKAPLPQARLTEQDIFLITYGDQFREPGRPPLQLLFDFLGTHLADELSGVHLLPFYPYSSDDGFSVIDYFQVNPDFGSWADVERLGERFRLMFDAVINHISSQSAWFQGFMRGEGPYRDYFITTDPRADLSQVTRPRTAPLLTPVETKNGLRHVWTTFSTDQIDLNFANPKVLLEVIDSLLCYVAHGAQVIRLDAIAYLWKEIGTTCIHLPQAHRVVKLFRALLDVVAPGVLLITETNVPHQENVSYFGDLLPDGLSTDEAQMVYQFPLAPLTLHTFLTGDATCLTNWIAGLSTPAPGSAFFNFTASHDGIGVRPAEGLLSPEEIQALAAQTLAHGGHVSYKSNPDGSQSAYELNITWFDALNDPSAPDPEMDLPRFLASQAIMLALAGVPGVYVHSLFGSRNCPSCVAETGRARSINRQKFHLPELFSELRTEGSHAARVFSGYRHLLQVRRMHPAFHPAAGQRVISLSPAVFSLLRTSSTQSECVLCLTNVTGHHQQLRIGLSSGELLEVLYWRDLLGEDQIIPSEGVLNCSLAPYQTRWLKSENYRV